MKEFIHNKISVTYPGRYILSSCPICITITFFEEGNETIIDFYKEKVVIKTKEGEDLLYVKPGEDGKIFAGDQIILYIHNFKGGIDYLLIDKKEIKQEREEKMKTMKDAIEADGIRPIIKPIKDSGERYVNEHGGMRDTDKGKPKFKYIDNEFLDQLLYPCWEQDMRVTYEDLAYHVYNVAKDNRSMRYIRETAKSLLLENYESYYEGLTAFALFMEEGAKKYSFENWKLLNTEKDIERFKESCLRHFVQWDMYQEDENHLLATIFNIMALRYHIRKQEE